MSELLVRLARRIQDEFGEIGHAVERAELAWGRAQETGDDLYLDSVALNLHAFYDGLEGLLEAISTTVDSARPDGMDWHRALLQQMATEAPGLRPAVLSEATRERLDEYRAFRHVVRHIYPSRFDAGQMRPLVEGVRVASQSVQRELLAFAEFLCGYVDGADEDRADPP